MENIFVITASNPDAKQHIRDTIENSIPSDKVEKFFTGKELEHVKKVGAVHGFYAWGAVPGLKKRKPNIDLWNRMRVGDHVLIYQDGNYTYYSRIAFKPKNPNPKFAIENWGKDGNNQTWEYIYFLETPVKFKEAVSTQKLADYFPSSYREFFKMSNSAVQRLTEDYGSIEAYFAAQLPHFKGRDRGLPNFWWVCQGITYKEERERSYLWAPNQDKRGVVPKHWASMNDVVVGDIIFHYANKVIKSISVVTKNAFDYKNELQKELWAKDGKRVDVAYYDIDEIPYARLKSHIQRMRSCIDKDNNPFTKDGGIKQGYLSSFSYDAAKIVRQIYNKPFPEPIEKYFVTGDSSKSFDVEDMIMNLLQSKKQIILYGPPGTGKTFIAAKIGASIIDYV